MAKSKYIEALEEQYTKKDGKSVLRYKAPDNKWRYVQTSKGASGGNMVEIKWQELKDKRDNGELTAGTLYRITDYNCTTTQENTQSAGHQFDIVLLALSENKLAEEGWAMEHPTDVYDVAFNDGITLKCYMYCTSVEDNSWNIVAVNTLLGLSNIDGTNECSINEETKTVIIADGMYSSEEMTEENLTYNYFQNSNLSAWKVWYCLDNDTARFAWADDRLILHEIMISGSPQDYIRTPESDLTIDGVKYYAWVWSSSPEFTLSETPKHGDALYQNFGGMQKTGECDKVFTNGRGVIYRLIDEWNNDVGYDFKNIQFNKELDNNAMWCYTFLEADESDNLYDCSTYNDGFVYNNFIEKTIDISEGGEYLSNNVLVYPTNSCIKGATNNLIRYSQFVTLTNSSGCEISNSHDGLELISCQDFTLDGDYGIYISNKKVLTEE